MSRRQRGMTFIGLLCILALLGLIGYAGLRLVPLYLNYMKVARSMDATASELKSDNPYPGGHPAFARETLADRRHFQRRGERSGIVKNDGGVSLHLAYDDAAPYIDNVSLSVAFRQNREDAVIPPSYPTGF